LKRLPGVARLLLAVVISAYSMAGMARADGFDMVALGVEGGLDSGNLSSYLIRASGDQHYLALDAGTLLPGIAQGLRRHAFGSLPAQGGDTPQGHVFHQLIAGYFISHAHLDHVAGLVVASPDDSGHKPVYALAGTNDALSRDYFNWSAWPNLADRGKPPALGRYRLQDEAPGAPFAVAGTTMSARIYPLWHDGVVSSMVLLKAGDDYFAYFGDTGPDALSGGHRLADIWAVLAPLVQRHVLKGMLIETSFPDDVPDKNLFGHLTPAWLLRELQALAQAAGGAHALRGLPVVIGHIKPSLQAGRDPRAVIAAELARGNTLGVAFRFPTQGERLRFP
jgi:3',5'-cyclic-nucleotide phosphodiesterase